MGQREFLGTLQPEPGIVSASAGQGPRSGGPRAVHRLGIARCSAGEAGIGRAVALAFAREGADLLISYLNEDENAQETVRVVEAAGRKAVAVAGDIGDEAHC